MRSKRSKLLLFFLNHPAHYHLFKHTINKLLQEGYRIKVVIVSKDILPKLVEKENWDVTNICPEGRRHNNLPILLSAFVNLWKSETRLFGFVCKHRPDILVGTEGTLAHVGFLLGKPSLLFNEDDTSATPENYLFYPFATKVIMPDTTDVGKWEKKKITYPGYHELAYLHPRYFTPKEDFVRTFNSEMKRYFIVRLADLTASHDAKKTGIDDNLLRELIALLSSKGRVLITAERKLKPEFEQHRIQINPYYMSHALYYADIYIGDSQTMTAEAAVLGTPAIRFNDFVGKLGYLQELEDKYELAIGIRTDEKDRLLDTVRELLEMPKLKEHWAEKRSRMLVEKTDVCTFITNVIEKTVWEKEGLLKEQ